MYAQLGDIKFELITYFDGLNSSQKIDYAEHATIEGKPKLQYIGEALETISIKLSFHTDFCNPQEELKKLRDAASRYEPLPFVFGNGIYKGKYVIEEIISEVIQTFNDATYINIEAEIKLKEWVEDRAITIKKEPKKTIKKKTSAGEQTKRGNYTDFDKGKIVRQK